MRYKLILLSSCMYFIFIINNIAYSYSLATHKALTEKAVSISKVSDQTFLKDTLEISSDLIERYKYFLAQGSIAEDMPISRAWNHFHNPLTNTGLNDMGQVGMSSVRWGLETESNEWSWKMARNFHYKAITGGNELIKTSAKISLFLSLGHLVHLIEDGAQPEHVRNDVHPENMLPWGFAFESWVETNFTNLNTQASAVVNFQKASDYWDTDKYNGSGIPSGAIGITEYSNFNFISKDTVFTENFPVNDPHYFPFPRKSNVVDPITQQIPPEEITAEDGNIDRVFYVKKKFDGEVIEHFAQASYVARDLYTVLGITDYYRLAYHLDDIVYRDYSNLLLPKAISYSAGLLNYFFRGNINMEKDPNSSGQYIIKNKSGENMSGIFSLYYDDSAGNRYPVQNASWNLTIPANGQSSSLTFTPPTDANQKGKYILVFQGTLGNEAGAVAGRVVKLEEEINYRVVTVYRKSSDYNYPWYGNITVLTKNGVITGKLPLTGYYQIYAVRFDVKDKNSFVVLTLNYDYTAKKYYYNFHKYSIDESILALTYQGVVLNEELYSKQETRTQIYEEDVSEYYSDWGMGSVFYKFFYVQGTTKRTAYSDFYLENGNIKPFGLITETSYSHITGDLYTGDGIYIESDNGVYSYITYIQNEQLYYGGVVVETQSYNCTGGYYYVNQHSRPGYVSCQPYGGKQTGNGISSPLAIFNSSDYTL